MASLEASTLTEEARAALDGFSTNLETYVTGVKDDIFPPSMAGDTAAALAAAPAYAQMYADAATNADQLLAELSERGQAVMAESEAAASSARTLVLALLGLSILGGVTAALWVARVITRPLRETVEVLQRVSEGDLTAKVGYVSQDEVGQMAQALNMTTTQFAEAVQAIGANSQVLASSAEELSSVSTQLSANAEETSSQAGVVSAAAEQVSSNVTTVATGSEEMSASIKEIASNANDASKVAVEGASAAQVANETVGKLSVSSCGDRGDRQDDHLDCGADQPVGAQCHDRGGACG